MTEELKNALITIAKYVGWEVVEHSDTKATLFERNGLFKFISHVKDETTFKYHTSADAILPVWRKVGEQIDDSDELTKKDQYHTGFGVESRHNDVGKTILNGNYESACIELANVINQIKEKV